MSIRVGELVSQLRTKSRVVNAKMSEVELVTSGEYSGSLRVGEDHFIWGDRTAQLFVNFAKGPGYKYLLNQPLGYQRDVVRHHCKQLADTDSVWYVDGNAPEGIYHPDDKIIPLIDIAEEVASVFDGDDWADVLFGQDQVEINVLSKRKLATVPGLPGIESRPMPGTVDGPDGIKVGDVSAGGVRIVTQPGKPERAPEVMEYWERYVCTNGMTRKVSGSQIKLRGRTVPEILAEMNNVMHQIYEGLDGSAQAILHSAETPVPGAVSDFLRVVARERNINPATVLRLQERAAELPPNPSVYDVTQIVTALANEDGLPVLTRRNLQAIGGDLTVDTQRMIHRCTQCERPLVAA